MSLHFGKARRDLIAAALDAAAFDYNPGDRDGQRIADQLVLAARNLVLAAEQQPKRPIISTCCNGSGIDDMCSGLPCQNPDCPVPLPDGWTVAGVNAAGNRIVVPPWATAEEPTRQLPNHSEVPS